MSAPRLLPRPNYGGAGGTLRVGAATYPIPSGVKVHRVGGLAYVLDVSGQLFLFTSAGQVEVPKPLGAMLTKKYFGQQDSGE